MKTIKQVTIAAVGLLGALGAGLALTPARAGTTALEYDKQFTVEGKALARQLLQEQIGELTATLKTKDQLLREGWNKEHDAVELGKSKWRAPNLGQVETLTSDEQKLALAEDPIFRTGLSTELAESTGRDPSTEEVDRAAAEFDANIAKLNQDLDGSHDALARAYHEGNFREARRIEDEVLDRHQDAQEAAKSDEADGISDDARAEMYRRMMVTAINRQAVERGPIAR